MKKTYQVLFLLIILLLSFYYDYDSYVFFRPQSVHAWRQADCASISLNYYQHGMNFFCPQVHNLNSDGGTTGFCATSEIPVLYYFTAILYGLFGPHEFFIRIINAIIFFLGLFFLFKLFFYLWEDYFWAIAFSVLFFTSPLLVYYGNSYITNVSALSFAIVGLYFFTRYYTERNKKALILSFVFFLLAGSFKVTALMCFFAIFGYFILGKLKIYSKDTPTIFHHNKLYLIGTFSVVIIVFGWILYARYFNQIHDCYYFSTTIFPIWKLSVDEINCFMLHIYKVWFSDYFHLSIHLLFLSMLVYIVFNVKRANKFHIITLLLLCVESIVYIILQFWTFHDHDYYVIEQNIVPIFIIITSFGIFYKKHFKIAKSPITKVIFTLLIIFNAHHVQSRVKDRYSGEQNSYHTEKNDIYTITSYLRKIGVSYDDKVVFIPDQCNVSLYLMNQQGWTQYTDARFNRGESIRYNQDSAGIAESIKHGAKYLILNDYSNIYSYPYVQSYTHNLIGNYGSVLIFNLSDSIRNFEIANLQLKDSIFCDAENLSGNDFKSNLLGVLLSNGSTQTNDFSYSGNFSSKLVPQNQYGMTITIKDCKYAERYVVDVWKKGAADACIVASCSVDNSFYLSEKEIVENDSIVHWQKIEMDFFIPMRLDGKTLSIYLFNPSSDPAYFDDFSIKRYMSPLEHREK